MADCKKCDRCGDFYETSDVFKKGVPNLRPLKNVVIAFNKIDLNSSSDSWIGPIDICPKCGEELYKWLKNEEENNGKP